MLLKNRVDAEITPEVAAKVQGIAIAGAANVGISKGGSYCKTRGLAYHRRQQPK
ncbi:hypothetical protein MASR2M70_13580 [Bacillota bacterium]